MIKTDLAFLLPVLENNNFLTSVCHTMLNMINLNKKRQFCIFNNYSEMMNVYNIPLLPVSHARYFDGDLLVFDLSSLLISINFPSTQNIYFYSHTIPWSSSYTNYSMWEKIFDKNNVKIIAANQHVHDIYDITWNNSLGVLEEFSYEKIIKFLQ